MQEQIPVTIIGGFLGAGKTTLLNRVLAEFHGVRFAVIVNDFGSLSIDDKLVRAHDGETITFANGCICCSLGDSLVATLDNVLASAPLPDHFLIEASGVADPRAIADIATLHPQLKRDLTVVLADAANFDARDRDERLKDTVERQLKCADLVVLNKCDLADDADAIGKRLTERFGVKPIHTINANFPVQALRAALSSESDAETTVPASARPPHQPENIFQTISVRLSAPVLESRLRQALEDARILRAKGFLKIIDRPGLTHVQQVGSRISFDQWAGSPQSPQLVAIGITGDMNATAISGLSADSDSDSIFDDDGESSTI